MHFVGPDQLHGFEERLTTDVYPVGVRLDARLDAPGRRAARVVPQHHEPARRERSRGGAADRLRRRGLLPRRAEDPRPLAAQDGAPFFLTVSFTNPHDPWEIRQRYWDLYDEHAIDLPAVGPIPRDEADPHSLRLRSMIGIDRRPLSDAEVRHARHGYYAALSYLDERIGEVLAALAATGLAENTLVVFTADHGELLGERGLWYKMSFLEGSSRVPLIVRAPSLAARRVQAARLAARPRPHARRSGGRTGQRREFEGTSLAAALTGESGGPGEAIGEYLARASEPRGDDQARAAQVHPLRGRSRPALRPHRGSTRAPQPRRRARLVRASLPPSGTRATNAGTWRGSSAGCSRASAHGGSSRARSRAARTPPGTSSRTSTRRSCTCAATPRVASAGAIPARRRASAC